jgi:hypothetical protein
VARTVFVGAECDVVALDGRCFFGGLVRCCHCVWSWTQARPASSGRVPFPFVGICGPLSRVSVLLLYSATTIILLGTQNNE